MKKADIDNILIVLKEQKSLSISDLATLTGLMKRRLFDVLPILNALGMVDRSKKGWVTWIEKEESKINGNYDGRRLEINTVGIIESVRRMGVQTLVIEQTAEGFQVNPLES